MVDEILSRLMKYNDIINDSNCLKILYYLSKYNPDIPVVELKENLGIENAVIEECLSKMVRTDIIFKTEQGHYTMTPFGRNAFKKLIESREATQSA